MIEKMGDKVNAKKTAIECGLPVVPGSDGAVKSLEEALEFIEDDELVEVTPTDIRLRKKILDPKNRFRENR